ncbi:MAG TPA: GTP diphosphokinase [Pseudomonadales bacterium]|nr:GTP diphosphokinase [Pseudomonadales bacterium]
MVKVRDDHPITAEGEIDLQSWCASLEQFVPQLVREPVLQAARWVQQIEQRDPSSQEYRDHSYDCLQMGLEMARIVAELHLDQDSIIAATLYRAVRRGKLPLEQVKQEFGSKIAKLIAGVQSMAAISAGSANNDSVFGKNQDQVKNIRAMLVAVIDDVRVLLLKLAERTCAIRAVKGLDPVRQQRVSREVFDFYVPMAHRLGVGHIEWELEDLSFRYLEPDAYQSIARLLDERRRDRDDYIQRVIQQIKQEMQSAGVAVQVYGRSKHIYSIWRKMQKKGLDFSQIYDVRAVRVLVPTVRDCYTTLGVVHSLWKHIPNEFDDYIANPKENGYRSLHTAVIGPQGRVVEVQIRTEEMHEEAEYGVCAHWLYKDPGKARKSKDYEEKIAWLQQALEWHEEMGGLGNIAEHLRSYERQERIYVFTPDDHVVSLPHNATPVDFAYHVHTEVGNSCRGAKVNGRIVPLNHPLQTGDRVEILRGPHSRPSRDWLNSSLQYIRTARARAKVQQWFRQQNREQNILDGRNLLEKEFQRLAITGIEPQQLADEVNLKSIDDVHADLGSGRLRLSQLLNAAQRIENRTAQRAQMELLPTTLARAARSEATLAKDAVAIQGVGNLLTQFASCCKPVPGDAITGFITRGRGVSIHRADCNNILQLEDNEPGRIIAVDWSGRTAQIYPVDILIEAYDRSGLLRDITTVLARDSINVIAVNTLSHKESGTATMRLTIEVTSFDELGKVLARINQLSNVIEARRFTAPA